MTRPPLLRVAIVVGLAAIASTEWHRVFGWSAVGSFLLPAVLLPAVIALGLRRVAARAVALPVVISIGAMCWYCAVTILKDSVASALPSGQAPSGIWHGLEDGWSQILSLPLPISDRHLLLLPAVTVWLAVAVGAEIALRSRYRLAAGAPATIAFGFALFFGIGGSGSRLGPALLFLLGLLALAERVSIRSSAKVDGAQTGHSRRGLEIGAVTVLALSIGVTLGPNLPLIGAHRPYDPRSGRVPPSQPASTISPLSLIDAWAQQPPHLLFTVHSERPVTTKLAVLSSYSSLDGWTDTSRFENIGATVPPVADPFIGFDSGGASVTDGAAKVETEEIHLTSLLPGPWLPVSGSPLDVHGVPVLADPTTGVLVSESGSVSGDSYMVQTTLPFTAVNCTGHGVVPSTAPSVSPGIANEARVLIGENAPPCTEARALLAALDNGSFVVNPKAPSGSNIQVLENFLYGGRPSSKQGTSEQFASAFALMAQSLGMDARVAVGFHAGIEKSPGEWLVDTNQAFAWAEVNFVGLGWVGFDPTPNSATVTPADEPDKGRSAANPTHSPAASTPEKFALPRSLVKRSTSSLVTLILTIVGSLLGGAAVIAALIAAAVGRTRRVRRRRRRENPDLRGRVIGAWRESEERLAESGVRVERSSTPEEVAERGIDLLGAEYADDLDWLAECMNGAMYSSLHFDGGSAEVAEDAWRRSDKITSAVEATDGRRERLLRSVDVRVLVHRQ